MTTPLYHDNQTLMEFSAEILSAGYDGTYSAIVLDATCFYPLSGGQPADKGTINGLEVVAVEKSGNDIVHTVKGKVEGTKATCVVDWNTRLDHMQQHTGQHILSQALYRRFGTDTDSLHIGKDTSYVDLPVKEVSRDDVNEVESQANGIVFSDVPIRTYTVDSTEDASFRKKSSVATNIRIVDIEGYDKTPCGGTHASRTGEVGPIHIPKAYRKGKAWRIEFVCGMRCVRMMQRNSRIVQEASEMLMVPPDEVVGAIGSVKDASASAARMAGAMREDMADLLLESFVSKNRKETVIKRIMDDIDIAKMVAQKASSSEGAVCVLGVKKQDFAMLYISSPPSSDINASALLKEALVHIKGRGGGSPHFATGRGTRPEGLEDALDTAELLAGKGMGNGESKK